MTLMNAQAVVFRANWPLAEGRSMEDHQLLRGPFPTEEEEARADVDQNRRGPVEHHLGRQRRAPSVTAAVAVTS